MTKKIFSIYEEVTLSQEQGLFLLIAKIGLLTKKAGVLF